MLESKEYIEIKINKNIKRITLNIKRRIWNNEEIDFTCIEIVKEDNIILNKPFEIEENSYNNNYNIKEYNQRGICNSSVGLKKEIEMDHGAIYYSEEYNDTFFYHDCNTEQGCSGGPIILIYNLKIIGMHKGYDKEEKKI